MCDGDQILIGSYSLVFEGSKDSVSRYSASESTIYFKKSDSKAPEDHQQQTDNSYSSQTHDTSNAKFKRFINWLASLFPVLQWAPRYNKVDLQGDLAASVTVTAMHIPQGMAYAMLAGLPPIYGLYASIAPPFIYALMGTSRQM